MNRSKWIIRKAKAVDAKGLKSCMDAAYSVYLNRFTEKLPPMVVDYEEEIAAFPVWVAESNNEVIGGLVLMFEDEYATIANVAVRPNFQGKGLGRSLLEFAESEAKSRGYMEIRLATHVLLTENVSYYLYLGWAEYNRDDNRVYMKKYIKS
ncbi:GNAT family N-acetyltransferase [Cytobacillus sp. IB215316]|uniref:GNAT family N-acetyltransferase n=1 Tax=Cytobacillus sp. IB215316 TaxID=3097354 RepID=UPI002A181CBF|nr:GNAT family N-acetyltransferase [Cytobacillus sp. IB215316]MDX8362716.1 GNAT family N-acetyltransferase [Cytobacillus sp. IB215316]